MKVLNVVGARPQFIKAAAVSRVLAGCTAVQEVLVHTGQHYDTNMSQVFFEELDITPPTYSLGVGSGSHGAQTGRMLQELENVMLIERPDVTLVYGDTNSTLAAALASAKLHIPVAHVEAGLRSFNRAMPEEINRIVADHVSDLLFAPTESAVNQLIREGIPSERIHLVGDVMYDVALYYSQKSDERSAILENIGLDSKSYILATVHRAENTDNEERLRSIFCGLVRLATLFNVVVPLHPRTRSVLTRLGILDSLEEKLRILSPVSYLDMVQLQKHALLVVTDSGGVQKEAFFYRVPAVTLRLETEWNELVELGWNRLIEEFSPDAVVSAVNHQLKVRPKMDQNLYGDGKAAEHIVSVLLSMCN